MGSHSTPFGTLGAMAEHALERPPRLPRGPHGLPRHEVERSQRDRLLVAAADAVAEKGYVATSVADVLARAGVSRTTFYQLFDDKLDCFLGACRMASDVVATIIADELARVVADDLTPLEKLDRLLRTYLQTLAANPSLARVFLVEVYAAGPAAIRQRRESLDRFIDLIAATHPDGSTLIGPNPDQRFAAEVLAGAVSSLVTTAVGTGELDRVTAIHEPLMALAARLLDP